MSKAISHMSDLTERIDAIPDAAPGDDVYAKRYLLRTGNTDVAPYLFGGDAA
jgi:hypothetical protein